MLVKDVPEQSISKEMIADLRLTSNFLDSYLIALEGWRRGLTVRWHSTVNHLLEYEDVFKLKPGQIFSLSTHNRTYNFMKALGDLNLGSINLVKNKDKTNEILKSYGINILEENSNLQTIVKKYHIYVTDNKVIGALSVEPSSITGDGIHTIQELIDRKNQLRKENPNYNRIIPIDDDFQKRLYTYGYYLDDILEKDTKLLLTDLSTIKLKEETYGIANEFPIEIENLAISAIQAFPDLTHGEVRIVVDENNNRYVSDINILSNISDYIFPLYGEPSNITESIIDLYFPETIGYDSYRLNNVYFSLENIIDSLHNQTVKIITVSPAPKEPLISKRFIVKGDVLKYNYHLGLRKELFDRDLHGKITSLKDRNLEIIVSGTDEGLIDEFKASLYNYPKRAKVKEVLEFPYEGGVKIGVEIKTAKYKRYRKAQRIQKSLDRVTDDLFVLEKEHSDYINSLSWKITYPLRVCSRLFKRERFKRVFPFL